MKTQKFALIIGTVMLGMGLLSLIPSLSPPSSWLPELKIMTSYGLFLDLFPMNIFNKVALIVFGILGMMAGSASVGHSIRYSRLIFVVMGILAIFGLVPYLNTLFGYIPLFGNEVIAHGAFAVLGAYFGNFASFATQPLADS